MIKLKRKLEPINISPTVWFYRNKRSIDLVHEIRGKDGKYIRTDQIHLTLRDLLGKGQ